MRFSERKGFRAVQRIVQKEGISDELRNSLWNLLDLHVWRSRGFVSNSGLTPKVVPFSERLWESYLKRPIDTIPEYSSRIIDVIRGYFFRCEWFEVYDFFEWMINKAGYRWLVPRVNAVLERELAGYRFVGSTFTDITNEAEIDLLEEVLADNEFPGVRAHLEAALRLLSNRESPDYRNSIKESISAVESMARSVTGKPQASLKAALTELERQQQLHPALKQGFLKLYGYTSDEGGIRHAMLEEPDLQPADAKFFLLSCSSFINYLKSKL